MIRLLKNIGLFLQDFIETIVTALVIFVIFYLFLFQPHQVKGKSMFPAFEDAEYLLTNKITYRFNNPQRGDIVIFKSPQNKKFDYIKRIIALPGEKINLKDGKVFINSSYLNESAYLAKDIYTKGSNFLPEEEELEIPKNQYFLIGDNRLHSSDSREWGFITRENIIGKAWLRYWPPSKFGFIPKIDW